MLLVFSADYKDGKIFACAPQSPLAHTGRPMWGRRDCHYAVQWSSNIWSRSGTLGAAQACPPACLWRPGCVSTCLSAWLHVCSSACTIICLSHSLIGWLWVDQRAHVCVRHWPPGIRYSFVWLQQIKRSFWKKTGPFSFPIMLCVSSLLASVLNLDV